MDLVSQSVLPFLLLGQEDVDELGDVDTELATLVGTADEARKSVCDGLVVEISTCPVCGCVSLCVVGRCRSPTVPSSAPVLLPHHVNLLNAHHLPFRLKK